MLRIISLVMVLIGFSTAAAASAGELRRPAADQHPVDIQGTVRFPGERPVPEGWEGPVALKLFEITTDSRSDVLADTPLLTLETNTTFDAVTHTSTFTFPGVSPGTYNITIESPGTLMIARRSFTVDQNEGSSLDMGTLLSGNANNDDRIDGEDLRIVTAAFFGHVP